MDGNVHQHDIPSSALATIPNNVQIDELGVCRLCGTASLLSVGGSDALGPNHGRNNDQNDQYLSMVYEPLVYDSILEGYVHKSCKEFHESQFLTSKLEVKLQILRTERNVLGLATNKRTRIGKKGKHGPKRIAKKNSCTNSKNKISSRVGKNATGKIINQFDQMCNIKRSTDYASDTNFESKEYCICGATDVSLGKNRKTGELVTEPFIACDGGCGGWYHPTCLGFARCNEHGTSRCLINISTGSTNNERKVDTSKLKGSHENISKAFICLDCRIKNPFHVIAHWPTPGQHYGTSARLLGMFFLIFVIYFADSMLLKKC